MAKKKKSTVAKKSTTKKQRTIDGAFAPRDEELEVLFVALLEADDRKKRANDRRTADYDSLKAALREKGFVDGERYYSYERRKRIFLNPEDPKIKIETVADDESTPFVGG